MTGIELLVDDPEEIQAYLGDIRAAAGKDLMIQTWKDRNQAFFNALTVERNVLFMVVTMVVLVAALNIISSLIMLVKDKSRDIAILRTMGATAGAMQRVFFITGAAIGVSGTIAGLLLGLADFAECGKHPQGHPVDVRRRSVQCTNSIIWRNCQRASIPRRCWSSP